MSQPKVFKFYNNSTGISKTIHTPYSATIEKQDKEEDTMTCSKNYEKCIEEKFELKINILNEKIDTKFETINSKIDALSENIYAYRDDARASKWALWGIVVAILVGFFAIGATLAAALI